MNIQDWFPLGLTGWISLQSKELWRISSTSQFKSINSSVLSFLCCPRWRDRATHHRQVLVESSGKTWSTGEGNGKPLQYSCLENPMNSMKRQKDRTLKDELPRSVRWGEVAQSCPTLCSPIDCSLPGSSISGIFQARVLEWVAISFSRRFSWPRDQTLVSRIAGRVTSGEFWQNVVHWRRKWQTT